MQHHFLTKAFFSVYKEVYKNLLYFSKPKSFLPRLTVNSLISRDVFMLAGFPKGTACGAPKITLITVHRTFELGAISLGWLPRWRWFGGWDSSWGSSSSTPIGSAYTGAVEESRSVGLVGGLMARFSASSLVFSTDQKSLVN